MIFEGEIQSVKQVIEIADKYGYGNLIAHLKQRWALKLIEEYNFSEEQAIKAADVSAYPLKFDIIKQEN